MRSYFQASILAMALCGAAPLYCQTKTVDPARDARSSGPTADDQKQDKTDIKLAADIRKAVVADKSLSVLAHNVKIVARGGQVTLRGRVKTEDEKRAVVAKAEEVAGKGNVTDQLLLASASSHEN